MGAYPESDLAHGSLRVLQDRLLSEQDGVGVQLM